MEIINSINDIEIQKIIEIIDNPEENKQFFIGEGARICTSLSESDGIIEAISLFITENFIDLNYKFMHKCKVNYISKDIMQKISSLKTPPGILGLYKKKYDIILPKNIDSTFILYNLSDPGNIGTIIRTAVALNRKEIVLIDGCNHLSTKVIQASAGMIAHVKIYQTTWEEFYLKRSIKIPIYALDVSGEDISRISDNEMNICYIVIGNEAHGIPNDILKDVSRKLRIPMSIKCESLNAAISAAIAGYRSWRI